MKHTDKFTEIGCSDIEIGANMDYPIIMLWKNCYFLQKNNLFCPTII